MDLILFQPDIENEDDMAPVQQVLDEIRKSHYSGYYDYGSPHVDVRSGETFVTWDEYATSRRTLNCVMARACQCDTIFPKQAGTESLFRHDGDTSNEWDVVTTKLFRETLQASSTITSLKAMPWFLEGDAMAQFMNWFHGRGAVRLL